MKKKIITILIAFIVIVLIMFITHKDNSKIPTLRIDLNNTTLEEINNNSKKTKYKDNTIKLSYDKEVFTDTVTIKGRGNSTWIWDKKPYQITLSKDTDLLNLGKSSKWVLLANYIDETLLRNHTAFYMANLLDMEYSPLGKNVSLYIDNSYQGVYYVVPKIEISEASVNLKKDDGVLVELDNVYFYNEDDYTITSKYKDHLVLKEVKNKDLEEEAYYNFIAKYEYLERAVANHDWNKINEVIDIESLAKMQIVNELTRNNDAYRSSCFMYMDGKDDKIHFGPVWDFDRSFNNPTNLKQVEAPDEDIQSDKTYNKYSELFFQLVEFEEFNSVIKEIWEKYMINGLDKVKEEINSNYELLKSAASKNIKRWNYSKKYKEYIAEFTNTVESIYTSYEGYVLSTY